MEKIRLVQNASKRIKVAVPSSDMHKIQKKHYEQQIEKVSANTWNFFTIDAMKFGYEEREGQQNMALDIVDCLRDSEHIAVEAGVGI